MSFSFGPRHPAGAARCGAASLRSKLVWLAGAQSRQCRDVRFALCVVFAEFAKGKLVSLPGLCPGNASFPHKRPLPFVIPYSLRSKLTAPCQKGTVRCLFSFIGPAPRTPRPFCKAAAETKAAGQAAGGRTVFRSVRSRRQEGLPGKFLKYPLANRKKRWYNGKALGGVAHLGERLNGIQEVVGSIPIVSTKEKGIHIGCLFCFVCKPRP